jgi:hypothetical protein
MGSKHKDLVQGIERIIVNAAVTSSLHRPVVGKRGDVATENIK